MIVGFDPVCGADRSALCFGEFMSDGTLVLTPKILPYQPRDDEELIGLAELLAVGKFPINEVRRTVENLCAFGKRKS